MSHKYDVDSDQLKCNFCTQWFKTTLHYANLQRYSLKACNKCLSNFNYTILHPQTYQIYKLFLFDLNINIPTPNCSQQIDHQLVLQFNIAKEQTRSKIACYFEAKIKQLMVEMEKATSKMEEFARDIEANYLNKIKLEECDKLEKSKIQILKKIDEFKNRPIELWKQQEPKLIKMASSVIMASINKSGPSYNKENEPINKASCRAIRDKINKPRILQSSKDSKVLSKSKQSHKLDNPLSKSLKRSVIMKSAKCLDNSRIWTPNSNFQQSQRAQIERLLQSHNSKETYLPCQLTRDNTFLHKCQSKRTHADSILDLRSRTSKGGQLIQLIGAQASKISFQCFLESLGSQSSAKVIRVIKSGITDYDFDALLKFVSRHAGIETLIVTNNHLTEISVSTLTNFLKRNPTSSLKRVYMGNNRIFRDKLSGVMRQIEEKGVEICL